MQSVWLQFCSGNDAPQRRRCCSQSFTAVLLLQNGKTEYKSVTVAEDSTAEEFMDFYLDDDTRATWVCSSLPSAFALSLVNLPRLDVSCLITPSQL